LETPKLEIPDKKPPPQDGKNITINLEIPDDLKIVPKLEIPIIIDFPNSEIIPKIEMDNPKLVVPLELGIIEIHETNSPPEKWKKKNKSILDKSIPIMVEPIEEEGGKLLFNNKRQVIVLTDDDQLPINPTEPVVCPVCCIKILHDINEHLDLHFEQ